MSVTLIGVPSRNPDLITDRQGKKIRTLLVKTWKQILRLQREARAEGFGSKFYCPTCQTPIVMTVPSKTDPRLECTCTTWIGM